MNLTKETKMTKRGPLKKRKILMDREPSHSLWVLLIKTNTRTHLIGVAWGRAKQRLNLRLVAVSAYLLSEMGDVGWAMKKGRQRGERVQESAMKERIKTMINKQKIKLKTHRHFHPYLPVHPESRWNPIERDSMNQSPLLRTPWSQR